MVIRRNAKGASVKTESGFDMERSPVVIQIKPSAWKRIVDSLYDGMYLHEWDKRYNNPDILDGEQWELVITMTGGRTRSYYGSNAYPPYWKELKRLFKRYS